MTTISWPTDVKGHVQKVEEMKKGHHILEDRHYIHKNRESVDVSSMYRVRSREESAHA